MYNWDVILQDEEYVWLKKQFDENFGPFSMPGLNHDEYGTFKKYKEFCHKELERRFKEKEENEKDV